MLCEPPTRRTVIIDSARLSTAITQPWRLRYANTCISVGQRVEKVLSTLQGAGHCQIGPVYIMTVSQAWLPWPAVLTDTVVATSPGTATRRSDKAGAAARRET